MRVELTKENVYVVNWRHFILLEDGQTGTSCVIKKIVEGKPVAISTGESRLSNRDTYKKDVGRKVSLTRALHVFNSDIESKRAFWEAYYRMRNGKW